MTADPALARNRAFYDPLWTHARLIPPERFNTWPVIARLATGPRLEIGPGMHPRLPLAGSDFLDASPAAARALRAAGGRSVVGTLTALPYPTGGFALIVALDVIEHVTDEHAAFAELARVAAPGAALLLSVPLDAGRWSRFDDTVGHTRRYDLPGLARILTTHGWTVEASAGFGLRPRFPALVALGMWFLARQPARAMHWYNRALPGTLARQAPLTLVPGLGGVDPRTEAVILLARRSPTSACI